MSPYIRRYAKYLNEKALAYRTVAFDFCKVKRGWVNSIFITLHYFAIFALMGLCVCMLVNMVLTFCCPSCACLLTWCHQERGWHTTYNGGRQAAQNIASSARPDWCPVGVWLFGQRSDQWRCQYGFLATLPRSDPPLCLLQWRHYQPPRSVKQTTSMKNICFSFTDKHFFCVCVLWWPSSRRKNSSAINREIFWNEQKTVQRCARLLQKVLGQDGPRCWISKSGWKCGHRQRRHSWFDKGMHGLFSFYNDQ